MSKNFLKFKREIVKFKKQVKKFDKSLKTKYAKLLFNLRFNLKFSKVLKRYAEIEKTLSKLESKQINIKDENN